MKCAIVLLTRGYSSYDQYFKLIQRNNHIYENFNKNLKQQYPLLIFHEGNISTDQQKFIFESSGNKDVRFIDVGSVFKWPQYCDIRSMKDQYNFGPQYRLMCAFNSFYIWNYVKEFDYIFRIDEDVLISNLDYDPFVYMNENNLNYLVSRYCYESHTLTNETIPKFVESIIPNNWTSKDYDQSELWVPYTNLYVAKTSLFNRKDVNEFLSKLIQNPDFFYNRWGDHVVSGIVLKAFCEKDKIHLMDNFSFYHGSHDCLTVNGKAVRGILHEYEAEYFNCIASSQGSNYYIKQN